MTPNPILDELHTIKDEYAESLNYDVDAIFEDLQRRQRERGIELVSFHPIEAGVGEEQTPVLGSE